MREERVGVLRTDLHGSVGWLYGWWEHPLGQWPYSQPPGRGRPAWSDYSLHLIITCVLWKSAAGWCWTIMHCDGWDSPTLMYSCAEYLRGFEAFAQTSFTIIGSSSQSFEWKGYGLKLHVPEGTFLEKEEGCTINIKAGLSSMTTILSLLVAYTGCPALRTSWNLWP